jgi:hypothetical protein
MAGEDSSTQANQGNTQGTQNATAAQGSETPPSFDSWLGSQDETVKGLISSHTAGLKSALESERGTRKEQEKQLRELAAKAEKGSEAETQLTALADKLAANDKRVTAYETLSAAGCSNLKLAWLAATEAGLVDGQGNISIEKLRTQFPELFRSTVGAPPKGNAGTGAGQTGASGKSMNDFIRAAAGR